MSAQFQDPSTQSHFSADSKGSVQQVTLKVKKLPHFKGELPSYASPLASGFDIRAQIPSTLVIYPGERVLVPTGLSFEITPGYELQARPRSGLAYKQGLAVLNSPGTIDADYRGEVKIILANLGKEPIEIHDQDRVAQLVLAPVVLARLEVVSELGSTLRGEGGFGSTGVSAN